MATAFFADAAVLLQLSAVKDGVECVWPGTTEAYSR